jgi:hypothetical protein
VDFSPSKVFHNDSRLQGALDSRSRSKLHGLSPIRESEEGSFVERFCPFIFLPEVLIGGNAAS